MTTEKKTTPIIYVAVAAVLTIGLAIGGIALAASGGDESVDDAATTESDDGSVVENSDAESTFVGLPAPDAVARAETEGREWRVRRRDDQSFALNDDLVPGRVTFEIDDGIVTAASVEVAATDPPPGGEVVFEDDAQARLVADAVRRIVTTDNSFGGEDVFDQVLVGRSIDGDRPRPLQGLDLEVIAGSLADVADVTFIDDPEAVIDDLFDDPPRGTAVVSVTDLVLLDDRAEVGLHLWCGPLCGVFLTYEAQPTGDGWQIVGTTGPIAVS